MFKRLRSLFRVLTRRRDFEDGMTEELRFHIEQYADDLVHSMSSEKAARQARMEFGSLESAKGDCREERGLHLFDEFRRELSYAVRLLRKTPGFTATALLTLAVCLGANLTIFAVIDSVLLRPLPFPGSNRLMTIFNTYPKAGVERDGSSLTNYYERRGHIPAFTSLAIYSYGTEIIGEPGSTEREQTMRVSPDFFTTLGLGPVIGRTFTEEETTSQTDHVAILSDAFWRQRYNADPDVMAHMQKTMSREESDAFVARIEEEFDDCGFGLWAVEVPNHSPFIGFVGLHRVPFDAPFTPAVEVGWRLAREHWGYGFVTEAARSAVRYGLEEVGLDEIVSFTNPDNVRSWKVMERLGMKFLGEGSEAGTIRYHITRADWQHQTDQNAETPRRGERFCG